MRQAMQAWISLLVAVVSPHAVVSIGPAVSLNALSVRELLLLNLMSDCRIKVILKLNKLLEDVVDEHSV